MLITILSVYLLHLKNTIRKQFKGEKKAPQNISATRTEIRITDIINVVIIIAFFSNSEISSRAT